MVRARGVSGRGGGYPGTVRDALVLLLAAGTAGTIVWRLTVGAGPSRRTPRAERVAHPRQAPQRRRRVRFDETADATLTQVLGAGGMAFALEGSGGLDLPPHRGWSLLRLILTVAMVGATIAAGVGALGWFLFRAIAGFVTSS